MLELQTVIMHINLFFRSIPNEREKISAAFDRVVEMSFMVWVLILFASKSAFPASWGYSCEQGITAG